MSDLSAEDRGFTVGHGLFETVLLADGRLERWDAHLDRLVRSCPVLGLPAPDPATCWRAAETALSAAGSPARAALRLNWSAGRGGRGLDMPSPMAPVLTATATPLGPPATSMRLATAATRRNDASPASRLKSLSYLDNVLARAEARAAGAEEALMLNTRGEVACAAAANVFWVQDGAVFTPALGCGVLDGILRAEVLVACERLSIPLAVVRAAPDALAGAAMFLTNSLIGVCPVSHLDGRALPTSPILAEIAGRLRSGAN